MCVVCITLNGECFEFCTHTVQLYRNYTVLWTGMHTILYHIQVEVVARQRAPTLRAPRTCLLLQAIKWRFYSCMTSNKRHCGYICYDSCDVFRAHGQSSIRSGNMPWTWSAPLSCPSHSHSAGMLIHDASNMSVVSWLLHVLYLET